MTDEHDYEGFGFDAGKKEVHLWNPWSNNFSPKGSPGLENGYPTKDGQFTMPLKDFLHVFRGIAHETDQRAARK